jgi:cyanate permease
VNTNPQVRPRAATGGPLVLALMCLVALNLRSVSVGVAPVLPLIREEFAVSFALAGVLFALPIAMMGLWAEPGRRLVDRWGPWRAIALSLALIGLGGGLRGLASDYAVMLGLTALFGAGIGLAQPSLPRLVAQRFPVRRAFATGVYSAGLTGGAVVGALLTPLLLPALGDVGWLPSYYQELGLAVEAATVAFTLLNLTSLPCGLLASYFSDRVHKRRPFVAVGALMLLAGMAGLLLTPLQPAWLWPALAGGGIGIVFTLALALPTDLLDPRRAGPTVSLVFTVGYGAALVSPLLAGVIRDASGSFTLALLPTVATGVAMLVTAFVLPETARGLHGLTGGPKR